MEKFLDDFAKLTVQQKSLGFVLAIALVVAVAYLWGISGTQSKIAKNKEDIARQRTQLVKLEVQARDRNRYMQEVERLKQRLGEAEEQLPKKAEVPKLLRDISYEAQQSGLRILNFEVGVEQTEEEFAQVPVNMDVKGSYHEIAVFFDRLSKMSRIVNVSGLQMGEPAFENKKIVLGGQFTATTYRFIEEKK